MSYSDALPDALLGATRPGPLPRLTSVERPLEATGPQATAPLYWRDAEDRPQQAALETLVRERFACDHGARVSHFLPRLSGLWQGEQPQAAVGVQCAAEGHLFLETYLDVPIETALGGVFGQPVTRASIVEIGNLACRRAGLQRALMLHLIEQLHAEGHAWLVFTATPAVRNGFRRLGLSASPLALADPGRLSAASREAWGRYYDLAPWVMGGSLALAHGCLETQGLLPTRQREGTHGR